MDTRLTAVIDLGCIEKNIDGMYERLCDAGYPGIGIMAVIKADGYGHGAVPIAKLLEGKPFIKGFAVATCSEALELRRAGINSLILILGFTFPESYEDLVRYDIRPAVFKYDMAEALSNEALRQGKKAKIHIKLDTGMGRIGYVPSPESALEIQRIAALEGIETEGVFTHFARADMTDKSYTDGQIEKFISFTDELKDKYGVDFSIRHCQNSAGIIRFPDACGHGKLLGMARAGITTYGLWPSDEVERDIMPLYPAMSLISHIAYIKTVPAGTPISYGGTFVSDSEMKVATIPAGYADGVPRSLSGKGSVLIRGKRAPILGRVCMDQFMVDVTGIPEVAEGDRTVLIGRDGEDAITFEEWQSLTGLLNYELACHIGKRVLRLIEQPKNGKI